jgi:Cytochrome c554 and c-prime
MKAAERQTSGATWAQLRCYENFSKMGSPLFRLVLATCLLGALNASAHDFLGSESCQGCHPDAYAAWQTSKHARARDVLSVQQQKDARCLSCHSPNQSDQRISHVSCEACHGGGQYYSARFVMKDPEVARLVGLVDPTEKSCRGCHDGSSPSLKPFDFASKLKAIDHWSIERQKRKGPVEKAP